MPSDREQETGTPDDPQSLLSVNRRNREVASAIRNRLAIERSARQLAASQSTTASIRDDLRDLVLPDAPAPPRHGKLNKEMSTKPVLFYGKPSQIDDVLTHVTVKVLADNITEDSAKCGYLASLYRGPALSWLTTYLKKNTLDDYEEFVAQTKTAFALPDEALQGQLSRQLTHLRQKGSVQNYALQFRQLADQVQLPGPIAKAQFIAGLKPHIQRALITGDDKESLSAAITEAIRIDSELFNIRGSTRTFQKNKSKTPGRDHKGRFTPAIKHEY